MSLLETLQKLGLGEKEAAIYLAGLELGPASVKSLAIKSKVKRTTIYQLLEELKRKDLFTETLKKKKPFYIAAHPNQLKILLNEQNEMLKRKFDDFISITNTNLGKPTVELYDTVEGVHKMYEDALKEAADETIGIAGDEIVSGLEEEWLLKYIQKRKNTNAGAKTIMTDSKLAKKWQAQDETHNRETKLLLECEKFPVNIEVVGSRVLITSLKGETLGLVIKSERVADGFRTILTELWKKLD